MAMRFVYKLILAAASGALVFESFFYADGGRQGWLLAFVVGYGWTGALFAVTILWPYLDRNNRPMVRGMGLVAASVLSFWCAIWTANQIAGTGFGRHMPHLEGFMAASIVGAAIVFISAKFIVPFPLSKKYVAFGLGAAVLGGWLFNFFDGISDDDYGVMAGFIAWHCLMCTSLHFSTLPDRKMVGAHAAN